MSVTTVTFPDSHLTVTISRGPVTRLTIHDDDGKPARLTSAQYDHITAVLRDVARDLRDNR